MARAIGVGVGVGVGVAVASASRRPARRGTVRRRDVARRARADDDDDDDEGLARTTAMMHGENRRAAADRARARASAPPAFMPAADEDDEGAMVFDDDDDDEDAGVEARREGADVGVSGRDGARAARDEAEARAVIEATVSRLKDRQANKVAAASSGAACRGARRARWSLPLARQPPRPLPHAALYDAASAAPPSLRDEVRTVACPKRLSSWCYPLLEGHWHRPSLRCCSYPCLSHRPGYHSSCACRRLARAA